MCLKVAKAEYEYEINSNMRCIEICNADTYDRVGGRINSNMRCIEIVDHIGYITEHLR